MKTFVRVSSAAVIALGFALVGCGDDESSTTTTNDPPPQVGCGNQSLQSMGNDCTLTMTNCTDSSEYVISCPDTSSAPYTCNCEKDSAAAGSFTSSDACNSGSNARTQANPACGWNIQ